MERVDRMDTAQTNVPFCPQHQPSDSILHPLNTHPHTQNRHHLLLVSLLLLNAAAAEALPLFLGPSVRPSVCRYHPICTADTVRPTYPPTNPTQKNPKPIATHHRLTTTTDALVPSWCAILVSVTLVLVLGEILPTTIFSGAFGDEHDEDGCVWDTLERVQVCRSRRSHARHAPICLTNFHLYHQSPSIIHAGPKQLRLVAGMVPVVWAIVAAFSPLAYPIARLLDCCFGRWRD